MNAVYDGTETDVVWELNKHWEISPLGKSPLQTELQRLMPEFQARWKKTKRKPIQSVTINEMHKVWVLENPFLRELKDFQPV